MPAESPRVVDTGGGLNVRYLGHNLYSPAAPVAAADRRAAAIAISPETLLFVPSPLLFYGMETLLAKLPEDAHILCVEVDQQLMQLSLRHAAPAMLHHPKVTYLRTDSVDAVLGTLHALGPGNFRRCREIALNAGRTVDRPLYERMFRALEYEVQSHWRNRMTLMHMSHLWLKNFFLNLPLFAEGEDIARLRVDMPIVVAGAGESLEPALTLLAAFRGLYYLLAVDTALPTLSGTGLRPDAVVVLDAQRANLDDLVGIDTSGIALIADVTAYPGCIRLFRGERWFFFSEFAELSLFARARSAGLLPTAVPPLGSVGVTALHCALSLTSRPVLFTGLDFSYQLGKSHARGAPAHVASLLRSGRLCPDAMYGQTVQRPHREVVDKTGGPIWTDNLLQGYSTALNLLVDKKRRVYDIGATGLPTGAPLLTDAESVKAALEGGRAAERAVELPPAREPPLAGQAKERARRFLREEQARIAASIELAIAALGRGGAAYPDLLTSIRELDFVYLHFPDYRDEPRPSEGFLKRFVEASESSARWIERSLELLGE